MTDATMAPPDEKLEPMTPKELEAWRKERGISRADLATKLEIAPGTVRNYEQGVRPIPPYMWRLLEHLDAEIREQNRPKRGRPPKSGRRQPPDAAPGRAER